MGLRRRGQMRIVRLAFLMSVVRRALLDSQACQRLIPSPSPQQTCCQRAFLADGFKSYWRSLGNVVSKSVVDCSLMQASR